MARANNNGWDFIEVGGIYQYKEDCFIGMVEVLEDNSDEKTYRFKIKVLKANCGDIGPEPFEVYFGKNFPGICSGMIQFYENEAYVMLPFGTPWPVDYTKDASPGKDGE